MSGHGFLVARRGRFEYDEFRAGDPVEVYRILDPFHIHDQIGPLSGVGVPWDAHGFACKQAERVDADRRIGQAREVRRIRCTECAQRPSLATVLVDAEGTTWVLVGPERMPSAFRRTTLHDPAQRAMPMHTHPNGSVHLELTTCRRCNQDWVIGIGSREVQSARVKATRGRHVVP